MTLLGLVVLVSVCSMIAAGIVESWNIYRDRRWRRKVAKVYRALEDWR
jgi:type II secretory pathway pseudopilin PulG